MASNTEIEHDVFIERLKAGDKKAFEQLYDNYSAALNGVISRVVRDEDAAADSLQDVFVKIWKNIEKYDATKGSIYTWMLNIARNTAIDKLRKIQREGVVEIQTFDTFVSNSSVHQTTMKVDHLGVKDVVDKLDPEQRLIIEYLYFGGYTQQEVSDELNIPLGTVKTRARNGLKELRKLISGFIFWI